MSGFTKTRMYWEAKFKISGSSYFFTSSDIHNYCNSAHCFLWSSTDPQKGVTFPTLSRTRIFMTKFTDLAIHSFWSHTNQFLIFARDTLNIEFSDMLLCIALTSAQFPKILYAVLTFPTHATCPTHLILKVLFAPVIPYPMNCINSYAMSSSHPLRSTQSAQHTALKQCSVMWQASFWPIEGDKIILINLYALRQGRKERGGTLVTPIWTVGRTVSNPPKTVMLGIKQ